MGIVKPLHLVPEQIHLGLAVGLDLGQGGELVDQLAVFEDGHQHLFRGEVAHRLPLPGGPGVEQADGLAALDFLVIDGEHVGDCLAGLVVVEPEDLLEVGVDDLLRVLADLDLGDNPPVVVLDGHQLVHAAEDRAGLGGDQPLAHAEGVQLGSLVEQRQTWIRNRIKKIKY